MPFTDLQIAALREGYRTGRFTPVDVAREVTARRDGYSDPAVWISRVPAEAIVERARRLMDTDESSLPLYGIPFAVKDNIDVAGMATTAGCPAFAYRAMQSAPVVEHLTAAGAILIGKTNLDQFATGLVGMRSPYGAPSCVFDSRYISGGSSSGSGVAVAAGLVSFALGTDTAGSGRVPAAFNNIVGLKPTRGLLSTRGTTPACRSLDCISVFANSVGDAVDVLRVSAGCDRADPWSRAAVPNLLPVQAPRAGILAESGRVFAGDQEAAELYRQAIDCATALGWRCIEIDYRPFREAAGLLYGGPRVGERLAAIREFVATHAADMDPVVRGIIENAGHTSNVDAFEAEYRLQELRRDADREWEKMDVLLLPTTPTILRKADVADDPVRLNNQLGVYTNFVNLLDLCAIAVPAGFRESNGLPFGISLVAPAFADESLAVLADRMHRSSGSGFGVQRQKPSPAAVFSPGRIGRSGCVMLAVFGAHLSGMPLNSELQQAGAVLLRQCRTAEDYRLFALRGTDPAKPGLLRDTGFRGPGIETEVWMLTEAAFGGFVSRIAAPLGIGQVELDDGSSVHGFLCESHALRDAEEITEFGGWRHYVAGRG